MASTQNAVHWLLSMAVLFALVVSGTAVAEGKPFQRVLDKLDTIERTVGPVPDEPGQSLRDTIEAIQDTVSPNLTRRNPRYVWAGVIDPRLLNDNNFAFIPDNPQFYLALNNGSLETQTKARVQGFKGQSKVIEFDTEIPRGSTVSVFELFFLTELREKNIPLPTLYLVSSNKKLIINATIERFNFHESSYSAAEGGYSTSVDFELLNCMDLENYAVHCAAPTGDYSWETFISR